jgi:hypothetical protein
MHPAYAAGPGDGPGQMTHFAAEGFNMFRIPVSWQYLTNSYGTAVSTLDIKADGTGNFDIYKKYDHLYRRIEAR